MKHDLLCSDGDNQYRKNSIQGQEEGKKQQLCKCLRWESAVQPSLWYSHSLTASVCISATFLTAEITTRLMLARVMSFFF